MESRHIILLAKTILAVPAVYFLGTFVLADNVGSALPYCIIALISAYYHRDLKTGIVNLFASYPRPAIIALFYVSLFVSIVLTNIDGAIGIMFRVVSAIVAWFAGAYAANMVGGMFGRMARRMSGNADFGKGLIDKIDGIFKHHPDPLLRGDLAAYAEARYPKDIFPEYHSPIHEDLVRPIISNGKLASGEDQLVLMYRRLSVETVRQLFNSSLKRASRTAEFAIILALAAMLAVGTASFQKNSAMVDQSFQTVAHANQLSVTLDRDVWSKEEAAATIADLKEEAGSSKFSATLVKGLVAILSSLTALAVGAFVAAASLIYLFVIAMSPKMIRANANAVVNADLGLSLETKSIARQKKSVGATAMEHSAYRSQIEATNADTSPLMQLGVGTGEVILRGSQLGYMPNQPVRWSVNDANTNLLVLGAIGSGKTYSVLSPMVRQILGLMDQPKDFKVSVFSMCAKGVFNQDTARMASEFGVPCRVIGHQEGEWGVDLFGSLDPIIIQTALVEIMKMRSAGTGDSQPIFKDMASAIILNCAVLAQAYECTPDGTAEINETGERMYSPVGVYKLAMSVREPGGRMYRVIESILSAVETDVEDIACFCGAGLISAMDFIITELPTYPADTLGSFLTNVSHTLGGFSSHDGMRAAFGAASLPADRMMNIESIWDDGVATTVNLSSFDGGESARVTQVFVKQRVYHNARLRNKADPDVAKKSRLFLVFDEAQEILSAGGSYGEASFLGFARSTGLSFIMAMPGISALYSAMGETPTGQNSKKILEAFRTQMILSTQGLETVDYIKGLVGTTLRSTVTDHEEHESYWHYRFEHGDRSMSDDIAPYAYEDSDIDRIDRGYSMSKITPEFRTHVRLESEFIASTLTGTAQNPAQIDWVEKKKSIIQRRDDKRKDFLSSGHSEEALVRTEDLTLIGRGSAFCIVQRGGHTKMDFIRLDPNLGRRAEKVIRADLLEVAMA